MYLILAFLPGGFPQAPPGCRYSAVYGVSGELTDYKDGLGIPPADRRQTAPWPV